MNPMTYYMLGQLAAKPSTAEATPIRQSTEQERLEWSVIEVGMVVLCVVAAIVFGRFFAPQPPSARAQ